MFILWLSHFDVNLFRHRHFRFSQRQCKIEHMVYTKWTVVDLRRFLQKSGVSRSFNWKYYHLERLCKLAHEINLRVINRNIDT